MSNVKTSTLNKTKVVSVVNLATELEEEGEEEMKRRRMRKEAILLSHSSQLKYAKESLIHTNAMCHV